MADDTILAAVTGIVALLATNCKTVSIPSSCSTPQITLPGHNTLAKSTLEVELQKLTFRVSQLEQYAFTSISTSLSQTPGKPVATKRLRNPDPVSALKRRRGSTPIPGPKPSQIHVYNDRRDGPAPTIYQATREALERQGEQVGGKSELLDSPIYIVSDVEAECIELKDSPKSNVEMLAPTPVRMFNREMWKDREANEDYRRVLREAGQIVTAVERGDLTKNARLNAIEPNPESTTFKLAVNSMIDRLRTVFSEVSRLCHQGGNDILGGQVLVGKDVVGLNGREGAQANIAGLDGCWKDITADVNTMASNLVYAPHGSELCRCSLHTVCSELLY
jgi:osomolarity two-component system sensor histidine kinase NIK1